MKGIGHNFSDPGVVWQGQDQWLCTFTFLRIHKMPTTSIVPKIQIASTAFLMPTAPTFSQFDTCKNRAHIYGEFGLFLVFFSRFSSIFPYQGQRQGEWWQGDNGQKTNLSFATGFQRISCVTQPFYCILSFNPVLPNLENVYNVCDHFIKWKLILKSVWEGDILNMMVLHVWIFIETEKEKFGHIRAACMYSCLAINLGNVFTPLYTCQHKTCTSQLLCSQIQQHLKKFFAGRFNI